MPLSREEFEHAVQAGLGRAFLQVRSYGDYPEVVLDFCRRHPAYDPQCEYDRTEWIFELVLASGLAEEAVAAVGETLREGTRCYDIQHAAHLACNLARLGATGAREALYAALSRNLKEDWAVVNPLVALDGPDRILRRRSESKPVRSKREAPPTSAPAFTSRSLPMPTYPGLISSASASQRPEGSNTRREVGSVGSNQ